MKLHRLVVKNFRTLSGDRTYTFPDGIIGITGTNGQGKSTLVNAIAWVLHGPEVLPTGRADVVTWGERECWVILEFQIGEDVYYVMRSQSVGGRGHAVARRNGEDVATGLEATTQWATDLLGVDRVGFLVSVFSSQEDLAALSNLAPAMRMKSILRLLGIDHLDGAIAKVREEASEARRGLALLRNGLPDVDNYRSLRKRTELELVDVQTNVRTFEARRSDTDERIEELAARERSLREQDAAWEAEQRSRMTAAARLRVSRENSERLKRAIPTARTTPAEPIYGEVPAAASSEEMAAAHSALRAAQERYTGVKNRICPTCHRPYGEDEGADLEEEHRRLELAQAEWDELVRRQAANRTAVEANERARRQYETALADARQSQERRHEAIARWEEALAEARQAEYEMPDRSEEVVNVRPELEATQAELQDLYRQASYDRGELAELQSTVRECERTIRMCEEKEAEWEGRRGEVTTAEKRLVSIETAVTEMGRLKESLIGRVIPMLAERASSLVTQMTDGKYTELALTSDYDIQFRNSAGDLKSFANLSGGEKDVFALALRLAIAESRAANVGFLVLDEVLESLDAERQELVWAALERLQSKYHQILMVTHVQAFRDRAPNLIAV